jgi:IS30 family transposase
MIGKANKTAIGTLVERSTGYALLVHLPDGYKPEQVAPALAAKIHTLPETLRRSLTWDQGAEMRDWKQVRINTGIEIYFCDPKSPWQRGTNENTNGLLRQYFPKGTDLATITALDLDRVADELNDRPRKRLGFHNPNETPRRATVALTAWIRRSLPGRSRVAGQAVAPTTVSEHTRAFDRQGRRCVHRGCVRQ